MHPKEEGAIHPAMPPGKIGRGPTNTRGGSTGIRLISGEQPMRDAIATARGTSTSWNDSNQGRSQPSDSTEGKRIRMVKRDFHVMQRQWPQRSNL